jgi:hypothetical protein
LKHTNTSLSKQRQDALSVYDRLVQEKRALELDMYEKVCLAPRIGRVLHVHWLIIDATTVCVDLERKETKDPTTTGSSDKQQQRWWLQSAGRSRTITDATTTATATQHYQRAKYKN